MPGVQIDRPRAGAEASRKRTSIPIQFGSTESCTACIWKGSHRHAICEDCLAFVLDLGLDVNPEARHADGSPRMVVPGMVSTGHGTTDREALAKVWRGQTKRDKPVQKPHAPRCTYCNQAGHRRDKCPQRDPVARRCKGCGQIGHIATNRDCPQYQGNASANARRGKPQMCSLCGKTGHRRPRCPEGNQDVAMHTYTP